VGFGVHRLKTRNGNLNGGSATPQTQRRRRPINIGEQFYL
jgi:hypothetical protein